MNRAFSVHSKSQTGNLGFEPRQTESESVVLPLHQFPNRELKILARACRRGKPLFDADKANMDALAASAAHHFSRDPLDARGGSGGRRSTSGRRSTRSWRSSRSWRGTRSRRSTSSRSSTRRLRVRSRRRSVAGWRGHRLRANGAAYRFVSLHSSLEVSDACARPGQFILRRRIRGRRRFRRSSTACSVRGCLGRRSRRCCTCRCCSRVRSRRT